MTKTRICTFLTVVAVIILGTIGLLYRDTYTDVVASPNYLNTLMVAEIPGNLVNQECANLRQELQKCPIILRVTPSGEMEHMFGISRQKVIIQEVYSGEDIQAGEEIYLTSSRWRLCVEDTIRSIERGFVNILKNEKEYLVFCEERIALPYEVNIPIYRLANEEALIAPVFCYSEVESVIIPVNEGEATYVHYSQVQENEFFVTTKEGLEIWENLKEQMLGAYRAE